MSIISYQDLKPASAPPKRFDWPRMLLAVGLGIIVAGSVFWTTYLVTLVVYMQASVVGVVLHGAVLTGSAVSLMSHTFDTRNRSLVRDLKRGIWTALIISSTLLISPLVELTAVLCALILTPMALGVVAGTIGWMVGTKCVELLDYLVGTHQACQPLEASNHNYDTDFEKDDPQSDRVYTIKNGRIVERVASKSFKVESKLDDVGVEERTTLNSFRL